eukprot:14103206-Alexandrium_andersonii.AAC.1
MAISPRMPPSGPFAPLPGGSWCVAGARLPPLRAPPAIVPRLMLLSLGFRGCGVGGAWGFWSGVCMGSPG